MRDEETKDISYFALEGMMTHFSVIIKRLIMLCVALLVAWLLTIAGFLWYISLPIEELSTVSVENEDGNANYIGNDMIGDINNGEDK
jgi:cell division septal protein FtsQ